MSWIHLLWIVPLSGSLGAVTMALFAAGKYDDMMRRDQDE